MPHRSTARRRLNVRPRPAPVHLVLEPVEKRHYLGSTLDVLGSTLFGSSLAFLTWDWLMPASESRGDGPRPAGAAPSSAWLDPWATDVSQLPIVSVAYAESSRERESAGAATPPARAIEPEPALPAWPSDPLGDPMADPLRNDWLMDAAFASGPSRLPEMDSLEQFRFSGGGDASAGTAPGSPGPEANANTTSSDGSAASFVGANSGALPALPSSPAPPPSNASSLTGGAATAPAGPTVETLAQSAGHLPLRFEANLGQTDPQVKFLSRGPGYNLFLTADAAVLALNRPTSALVPPASRTLGRRSAESQAPLEMDVVRLAWLGANPNAQASGLALQPGISNYFTGNNPMSPFPK